MDEGWCIIDSSRAIEIQRDDDTPIFEDDDWALVHVRRMARRATTGGLHRRALDFVAMANADENDARAREAWGLGDPAL